MRNIDLLVELLENFTGPIDDGDVKNLEVWLDTFGLFSVLDIIYKNSPGNFPQVEALLIREYMKTKGSPTP